MLGTRTIDPTTFLSRRTINSLSTAIRLPNPQTASGPKSDMNADCISLKSIGQQGREEPMPLSGSAQVRKKSPTPPHKKNHVKKLLLHWKLQKITGNCSKIQ
jgi:hypothetical protein